MNLEHGPRPDLAAQDVMDKVAQMATLSPKTYEDGDYFGHTMTLFVETYDYLLPASKDKPTAITADTLQELSTRDYLRNHTEEIREAVASVKIPDTDITVFLHGGTYALLSKEGRLLDFIEQREGEVYNDNGENPHNAAPYAIVKPLAIYMLRALERDPDISNQDNNDLITQRVGKPRGGFHLGGLVVNIPTLDSEADEKVLGISSVESTPEALNYLLSTLREADAEHSIDPLDNGHYTAAGFLDELAGRIVEAYLNGKRGVDLQEITNKQWARLMTVAIPGPLPGQYD